MPEPSGTLTHVQLLETKLGCDWKALRKARKTTEDWRIKLDQLFLGTASPDTSVVVFGSVARREVTSKSDLDWVLLIDGQSVPEHKDQEKKTEHLLIDAQFIKPGSSGIFGKMIASHDIVHNIGGEGDLNSNTTRRVLLLLESHPAGHREVYDRVRRQVVRRYVEDDRGLTHASGDVRIPRFLLNDLTRYWRTVTVDFVYKQRADNDKKWALRNAKLRMSRKLIFAAGLALVFSCHLDDAAKEARLALKQKDCSLLTDYVERQFALTPLEIFAKACVELEVSDETAHDIFNSYDQFLAVLDDDIKRAELEAAKSHDDLRSSTAWSEIRELSRPFHQGLVKLFLEEHSGMKRLTMDYGVF